MSLAIIQRYLAYSQFMRLFLMIFFSLLSPTVVFAFVSIEHARV